MVFKQLCLAQLVQCWVQALPTSARATSPTTSRAGQLGRGAPHTGDTQEEPWPPRLGQGSHQGQAPWTEGLGNGWQEQSPLERSPVAGSNITKQSAASIIRYHSFPRSQRDGLGSTFPASTRMCLLFSPRSPSSPSSAAALLSWHRHYLFTDAPPVRCSLAEG